jgi:hypothetical protein
MFIIFTQKSKEIYNFDDNIISNILNLYPNQTIIYMDKNDQIHKLTQNTIILDIVCHANETIYFATIDDIINYNNYKKEMNIITFLFIVNNVNNPDKLNEINIWENIPELNKFIKLYCTLNDSKLSYTIVEILCGLTHIVHWWHLKGKLN